MQPSQPVRGKLTLRSSHRTLRLGISHSATASTWTAPSKDGAGKKGAPTQKTARR